MTSHQGSNALTIGLIALAVLVAAGGCQDSHARSRADVQKTIAQATAALRGADAQMGDPDRAAAVQQALRGVVSDLSRVTGGEAGQRAAALQLVAGAHRRLAAMSLAQAGAIEASQHGRRTGLDGMIDTALELNRQANAIESATTADVVAQLDSDRADAQQSLTIFSGEVARLDGPIADINQQNHEASLEVDRLRDESGRLRREASDLGPAEGYGSFERGLDLDRHADELERQIADRELKVRYDYESDHEIAQSGVEHIRQRLDTIQEVQQDLSRRADTMAAQAKATREALAQMRQAAGDQLKEINEASVSLVELYAAAAAELDQAASKAGSAASLARADAGSADSAGVLAAQAYEDLGGLFEAQARGLQEQIRLLDRLAGASGTMDLPTDSADLRAALEQATTKAQAAYTEAGNALGKMSGRTARTRLESLKTTIAALQSGQISQPPPPAPATGQAPTPAAGGATGGAASPQEPTR